MIHITHYDSDERLDDLTDKFINNAKKDSIYNSLHKLDVRCPIRKIIAINASIEDAYIPRMGDYIDYSNNNIKRLSDLKYITYLNISYNPMKVLDIDSPFIKILIANNCKLKSIKLSGLKLDKLDIRYNHIRNRTIKDTYIKELVE